MLSQLLTWYQTLGLDHSVAPVPGIEALILLALLTVCLLLRCSRSGLVIAYIFVYRWGLLFGRQNFSGNPPVYNKFLAFYVVFGILVLTLASIVMMARSHMHEHQ